MAYYKVCERCGATLELNEHCDCAEEQKEESVALSRVGRNIQARLDNIGMTKYELAILMKCSVYLIDDILQGKRHPSASMLINLSKKLRVSIEFLTK